MKLAREAAGYTQVDLAENLDIDVTTVQSWETGRRPLSSLRAADLIWLRRRLIQIGAPAPAVRQLDEAVEADVVIAAAVESGDSVHPADDHVLGGFVHRSSLTNLLTWSFTGFAPLPLSGMSRVKRRGPVADTPMLGATERERFFDHLLVTADAIQPDDAPLLRRQAIYLLGFDDRAQTADWLQREYERALAHMPCLDEVSRWITVRSSALALAWLGDDEPLRRFVAGSAESDAFNQANLNYWAYWVGDIPDPQPDDAFMFSDAHAWSGVRVMEHLLDRLNVRHAPLNIHSLWTLVLARPSLLHLHPQLRERASERIAQVMDTNLDTLSRRQLASLAYAVQLARR